MATAWTNRGRLRLADGTFDADNLTMALLVATIPAATIVDWNVDTDITDELDTLEVSNYVRTAMGSATITENDTTDEAEIDYGNTSFGALVAPAITPALTVSSFAVIRISTSEVMWVQDATVPSTPNGLTFTVDYPTGGPAFVGF